MKGITGNPALDAYHRMAVAAVGAARPAGRADTPAVSPEDNAAAEVRISPRARDLATEAGQASVDLQKVEALKQQIADGGFRIDTQKVAAKMIAQLA